MMVDIPIDLMTEETIRIDHGNGDHSVVELDGTITPMEYIGLGNESNETLYRRKR